MEGIMLFYRMIYPDKCRLEKIFRSSQTAICYRLVPDRSSSHPRTFQFLRHHVQNTIDKLTALGCAVIFRQLNIFVD